MAKRAILYARVSTGDEDSDAPKLGDQIDQCREHAISKGYQIVTEIQEAPHSSGVRMDLSGLHTS